jgi:hypothetical protein
MRDDPAQSVDDRHGFNGLILFRPGYHKVINDGFCVPEPIVRPSQLCYTCPSSAILALRVISYV